MHAWTCVWWSVVTSPCCTWLAVLCAEDSVLVLELLFYLFFPGHSSVRCSYVKATSLGSKLGPRWWQDVSLALSSSLLSSHVLIFFTRRFFLFFPSDLLPLPVNIFFSLAIFYLSAAYYWLLGVNSNRCFAAKYHRSLVVLLLTQMVWMESHLLLWPQ